MTTTPAPYIASLSATNLKLPSLSLALSQLTWISGKNGSGKTTIVDAFQLAGMGHVPRIGKNGPALAKLAGPGLEMSVSATLSDGTQISREWTRTATGMSGGKSPAGDMLPVFSLNPEALLAMNEDEMARTIAARFGVEGDPVAKITAAMAKAVKTVTLPKVKKSENFADWCEQMEVLLADSVKEQNATARRFKATVEGLAALENFTAEEVTEEELAAANAAAGAAAQRANDANEAYETALAKLGEMEAEGHVAAPELSRAALDEEKAGLVASIAELEAKQKAAAAGAERRANDQRLLDQMAARAEGVDIWLSQNETAPDLPEGEPLTAPDAEAITLACDAYTAAVADSAKKAAAQTAAESMQMTGEVCPCCGAVKANWDADKQWEMEAKLVEAKEAATEARERCARLLAVRDDLQAKKDRAEKDALARRLRASWESEHAQYTNRAEEIASMQREITSRMQEAPLFDMEDAEALAGYKSSLAEVEADLAQWDAHEASQTRLAALIEARKAVDELHTATGKANGENIAASEKAQALQAKAAASAAAKSEKAKLDEAKKTHADAVAAAAEWEAVQTAFRDEARKITEAIFKPLLELARPITAGCLPTELGHKGLSFGRWQGAHFIHLATFSQSEKYAAMAGLSAALAAHGRGIVIIDEFNNLDADKQPTMVENLTTALTAGVIAQAVLLDNSTVPPKLPPIGSMVRL